MTAFTPRTERELADLEPDIRARLSALITACPYPLGITSAWRSREEQQRLYDGYKAGEPGFNPANPPGMSKHEASTPDGKPASKAADLDYVYSRGSTTRAKTVRWVHAHAAEYGLHFPIRREDWHAESNGHPYSPPQEDEPMALTDDDKKWLTAMVDKRIALVIRGDRTHPDSIAKLRSELADLDVPRKVQPS